MTILQFVAVILGIGLVLFAVLLVLGLCRVAGEADDDTERIAARMKAEADHE